MLSIDTIKERIAPICKKYPIRKAYLFGSYARGEATENSDVDLLVDSNLHGLRFMGFVEELREALDDKDMDVFDVTHITPQSPIADEIQQTRIEIYAQ